MKAEQMEQERRRDRVQDPVRRWQDVMKRIEWAERNTVHRATPAACVREQRRLWSSLERAGRTENG